MPTMTTNFGLLQPLVNSSTDENLWGQFLNTDLANIDSLVLSSLNFVTSVNTAATLSVTAPTAASATIGSAKALFLCNATSTAIAADLPTASSAGNGFTVAFKKTDSSANAVTITPNNTDTIDAASTFVLAASKAWAIIVSDGISNWNILSENSSTPPSPVTINGSFKNLKGVWASNTTATYTADQLILQASVTASYLASSYSQTLSTGTSGAGGLDTGSLASSTWYFVYAIYGTGGTSILFSLSATSPTLPSGYTYFARVGSLYLDGSKNIRGFIQYGRRTQYVVGQNLTYLPIMATGTAGNVSTPTYVAVAVGAFVPPTASAIKVYTNNANGGNTLIAPNNSYGAAASSTTPPFSTIVQNGNSQPYSILVDLLLETTNIYWATGTTNSMVCLGYEDNL